MCVAATKKERFVTDVDSLKGSMNISQCNLCPEIVRLKTVKRGSRLSFSLAFLGEMLCSYAHVQCLYTYMLMPKRRRRNSFIGGFQSEPDDDDDHLLLLHPHRVLYLIFLIFSLERQKFFPISRQSKHDQL